MRLWEISDATRFWGILADLKVEFDEEYKEIIQLYDEVANFDHSSRVQYVLKCEHELLILVNDLLHNIGVFEENFRQSPFNEIEEIQKHREMVSVLAQIKQELD